MAESVSVRYVAETSSQPPGILTEIQVFLMNEDISLSRVDSVICDEIGREDGKLCENTNLQPPSLNPAHWSVLLCTLA